MNNISLYIPRVFDNVSEQRITDIFEKTCQLGQVSKIDCVSKKGADGKSYKSVYIHFKEWFNNESVVSFRKELADNKKVNVKYDNPWFWIVLEYKKKDNKQKERAMTVPNNSPIVKSPKRKFNSLNELALAIEDLSLRNLNREIDMETRRQMEDVMPIESMNLVDATYVRYLEQQNAALYSALVYHRSCDGMMNKKVD